MVDSDNYSSRKTNSIFGTDGIRGRVPTEITPALALAVGFTSGMTFAAEGPILIGMDSRNSGEMLASALTAGITAAGKDAWNVGICPTPAIPYLIKKLGAAGGLMVSASHNPPEDNGIKFFGTNGAKLDENAQRAIEKALNSEPLHNIADQTNKYGKTFHRNDLLKSYCESLIKSVGNNRLDGIRIVLDLCWGASTSCAESLFKELGADLIIINGEPNGEKINVNCGSTNLSPLMKEVISRGAEMGFAFDGDADRMLAVDGKGRIINGDHILYLWGSSLQDKGELAEQRLVATVMSNLGFEKAWEARGGILERTSVGDQNVYNTMVKTGSGLGGEQSGHILSKENGLSGDGLLSALQISTLCNSQGITLHEWLNKSFKPFPQKLVNICVPNNVVRKSWSSCEPLQAAVLDAEASMAGTGRVLVRASGTEPLLRVMVEADDQNAVDSWTKQLAHLADHHLNAA